ncbi:hypothetical protein LXD19_003554, partial [Acinetobacter baumannii]|nr:hypothetical protein [Acinetobacter baumannii]EKX7075299.1 hypothetical protein [Acinetobacter baumannii]
NLIGAPYKILLKKTGDILMVGTINDDLQTERVFTKEEEEIELILFETNYTDFNIENLDYLFGEE